VSTGGERMFPVHCPYCGDEDLRPHGQTHGSWECRACTRVFALRFVGMVVRPNDHESGRESR